MRVSKEKAAENRGRILEEAARLFRERGLAGVGVDGLAEAAGLTYGSLYSQFGSKEALTAAAIDHAFAGFADRMGAYKDLPAYLARYLSREHRDNPGNGCTVAALGGEMARQTPAVRQRFTEGIRQVMGRIVARLPAGRKRAREDEVLAILATMVGAVVLARAVDDPALSDRILAAARGHLGRGGRMMRRACLARRLRPVALIPN